MYKLFQDPTFFHWSLSNPVLELHCLNLLWLYKDLCIWLSPITLFYFFLIFKNSLHGSKIKGYKTIVCQRIETILGVLMLCCTVLCYSVVFDSLTGTENVDGQQDPFPSKCWRSQLSCQWGECSWAHYLWACYEQWAHMKCGNPQWKRVME